MLTNWGLIGVIFHRKRFQMLYFKIQKLTLCWLNNLKMKINTL